MWTPEVVGCKAGYEGTREKVRGRGGGQRLLEGGDVCVVDAVARLREHVLSRETIAQRLKRLGLHSTGSTRKRGFDEDAHALDAGVAADADACLLTNRTCELGTTRATL